MFHDRKAMTYRTRRHPGSVPETAPRGTAQTPHRYLLREAVARLRPRLVVLDPFVQLHRIDENAAAEVAPLLAYLRELRAAARPRLRRRALPPRAEGWPRPRQPGPARLLGAARWGDSNLYARRARRRALAACPGQATARGAAARYASGADPRRPRWRPRAADPPRAPRHLPPAQRHPDRHPRGPPGRRPRPRRVRPRPARPRLTNSRYRFPSRLRADGNGNGNSRCGVCAGPRHIHGAEHPANRAPRHSAGDPRSIAVRAIDTLK